ncbi:MAG: amidase [Acidobacteria bacterium]|nr:amidase [Acidobacteriota bacterium]
MTRRDLICSGAALALTGCVRPNQDHGAFDLLDTGLDEIVAGLHSGRWTSRGLARWYLERIDRLDSAARVAGPRLNSVLALHPHVMEQADALDQELKSKGPRSPLHGVPILLKDNIDTADIPTTAGSLALEHWTPPKDAFIAARLRAAGALILGKTNLSEWANFRSTHSSSGWSGRGGQTRNPHATDHSPSGSSSGSGAAVAASLCAAAVGTETDGSIVSPASVCGIVGVKPTVGVVSRSGIVPISHSQDTAGPMARSVRDAAILFDALVAPDPADAGARSFPVAFRATQSLDAKALQGARLGIPRKYFDRNQKMNRFLDAQVDALRKAGAEVIDEAELPSHGKLGDPEFEVMLYEYKADLNAYLATQPPSAPVRSIEQLIAFNDKQKDRELKWFGQEILHLALAKGPLTDQKYLDARRQCLQLSRDEGIDAVLRKHRLDAIVTLTNGPAWFIDWVNGDYDTGGCSTVAAVAGYPHITVPAGFVDGLPIGLSFFGTAFAEPRLFALAYSYEQATRARRKPSLKPGGAAPSSQA